METRSLGLSDIQITPILMGTWQAGKRMWVGIEDEESIKAIRGAFEAGITIIDTAEVYGEGHSEQIVAKALSPLSPHPSHPSHTSHPLPFFYPDSRFPTPHSL